MESLFWFWLIESIRQLHYATSAGILRGRGPYYTFVSINIQAEEENNAMLPNLERLHPTSWKKKSPIIKRAKWIKIN